jgi:hypothetical protein
MTEKAKGGRPSIEETRGEKTRTVKVIITESQYQYAKTQRGGISGFIRYAIDAMRQYRISGNEAQMKRAESLEDARELARNAWQEVERQHEETEEIIDNSNKNQSND